MHYKIGKIVAFDNYIGKIIDTNNNTYLFLDIDLMEKAQVGDIVAFNSETINDTNRAHFIYQYKKEKNLIRRKNEKNM